MTFKDYTNPLYENIPDEDWLSGYCCIFANALRERFNLPMHALMVKSLLDGDETLVHAFCLLDNEEMVDARGIRDKSAIWKDYASYTEKDWREIGCYSEGEIKLLVREVTLDQLWDLNPEDHEATNAAHEYIEANQELFDVLLHEPSRKSAKRMGLK